MSSVVNDNEEDDELIRLRVAALESMHNKNIKNKEQTNSSLINDNSKVNDISGHKTRTTLINNYYPRNGSKRSNLIVLTASESELRHKNSSNTKSENLFPKLNNKSTNECSESSSKRKRVLPGRFSRLEKEDNTDDDSEEYSDDNEDMIQFNSNESNDKLCAFNKVSVEELCYESDNTTNDVISDINHNNSKNGLNEETKDLISIIPNECTIIVNNLNNSLNNKSNNEIIVSNGEQIDESVCFASTSGKDINYTKIISDNRKDTIKLNNNNNNNISRLEAFKRRKQKFGDSSNHELISDFDNNSSHSSENSNNHIINNNSKKSIKNRLTMNSVKKEKKYLKNCRHRSISNNNDSKQSNMSFNGIEKSFNTRLNRETESEQDFD